jgi:NodT family efflux transporter outer membrane factor (OMF) lipoprotein
MTTTNTTLALRALALAGFATINTACTVLGPDYARPTIDVPTAYKEAPGLTTPQARDASTDGRWWGLYGDAQLDRLMAQIEIRNYSLQAIEAQTRQARSLAEIAQSARFPTLVAGGTNDFGLLANWEIDLWGRIRRNIEASGAAAQASAADLAAATLSLQAQLAQNYFQLRVQDADIRLLQDTATSYEQSLRITRNQYAVGVADRGAIAQAQAQLSTAQAQMHDARVARAQFEHAIAVLIGKAPADFSFAAAPIDVKVPEVPPTLPSDLLERRPDIAAAERRMAAASAQIGAAEAASYPSLDLFAGVSIRRGLLGGAKVVAPLYAGEAPQAGRAKASAAYDESVANYRQTVLNGFREVEDNLAALQILDQASDAQATAVKAAREAVAITDNQYRAGVVNYQSVIVTQATALVNERAALGLLGRRLAASVTLIKALGGGWAPAAPTVMGTKE